MTGIFSCLRKTHEIVTVCCLRSPLSQLLQQGRRFLFSPTTQFTTESTTSDSPLPPLLCRFYYLCPSSSVIKKKTKVHDWLTLCWQSLFPRLSAPFCRGPAFLTWWDTCLPLFPGTEETHPSLRVFPFYIFFLWRNFSCALHVLKPPP